MRYQVKLAVLVAFSIVVSACGATYSQHKGINHARLGVEAAAIAADASDLATHELFGPKPASNDAAYCKSKIAGVVFAQVRIALNGALDSILLWERALAVYEAKKAQGSETEADWQSVLSSEASWFKIIEQVVAVLEGVRQTLKLWSVKLPPALDYAWSFLSNLAGKPATTFEFDFSELQGSICFEQLPEG